MQVKLVFIVFQISLSFDVFKVKDVNGDERPSVIFGDCVVIIFITFVSSELNLIVEDDKIATGLSKINLSMEFSVHNFRRNE